MAAYERFSEIERAYEVLSDPARRISYDRSLEQNEKTRFVKKQEPQETTASRWKRIWILLAAIWLVVAIPFLTWHVYSHTPALGASIIDAVAGLSGNASFRKLILENIVYLVVPLIMLELIVRAIGWAITGANLKASIRDTWVVQSWRVLALSFALGVGLFISITTLTLQRQPTSSTPMPSRLPDVISDCSVNGLGNATCTFRNRGTAQGSTCVYVLLTHRDATAWRGSKLLGGPVCSGLVAAGDVRQIQQFLSFRSDKDYSFSPSEFCDGGYRVTWTTVCTLTTTEVR